jgi:DNA polymerase I
LLHKVGGPFSKIAFEKYDLDSPDQLKEFLFTLGWVPDLWNINKVTKERTSPKITESSLESIGSSDLGRWISRYYTLRHRRNTLENIKDPESKGLLSYLDEKNTVAADAFTIGTPSFRYRHQNPICNVPKADPKVIYGAEMRTAYCCHPPYYMVGSDLSGVEARLLGHFTSFFDGGEMARELLDGDIHSKNAELIKRDRNTAKTFFYA